MTTMLHHIRVLVAKDLRIEARTRQTIGIVVVLGVLIVVVLGLGLGAHQAVLGYGAPAVLWVAYLFAGVLCFEKTMAVERSDGALSALLMAPVERGTLFIAKLLTNLILMLAIAAVVTPAGILFFGFDLGAAPWTFVVVMALGLSGFAAIGTLFAQVASSTRLQGGLLAMMIFPVTLPLVLSSTQMLTAAFRDHQPLEATGLGVLIAFDAIALSAGWIVTEWVLEP